MVVRGVPGLATGRCHRRCRRHRCRRKWSALLRTLTVALLRHPTAEEAYRHQRQFLLLLLMLLLFLYDYLYSLYYFPLSLSVIRCFFSGLIVSGACFSAFSLGVFCHFSSFFALEYGFAYPFFAVFSSFLRGGFSSFGVKYPSSSSSKSPYSRIIFRR